jgi:alpha-galactosidase
MCLSGEVHDLSPTQWQLTVSAMELYRRVHPIIRDGHSTFHGETGKSWRHPQGWQAVLRTSKQGDRALLVAHAFANPFPRQVEITLPGGSWKIEEIWPKKGGLPGSLAGSTLNLKLSGEFRASVVVLQRC